MELKAAVAGGRVERLTYSPAEVARRAACPQRVVRRAPLPMAEEVRPLAPIRIERMRAAAASEREATILSVLGYAGLRPGELRILRWGHVRGRRCR